MSKDDVGSLTPRFSRRKKNSGNLFPQRKPVGGSYDKSPPDTLGTVPKFPSSRTKGRKPIQCYGCGTRHQVKVSYLQNELTLKRETESELCKDVIQLTSNSILKFDCSQNFWRKRLLYADTGASHTIGGSNFCDVTSSLRRSDHFINDG
ncbi:hypothetical protein NPIL_384471 [Nephila pilipes]|uniref:Uncharacterized protein n=1 Tax=Nephila pilipes TaxID=299642 RepID=A0A8X6PMF7_NEPPI|nr:hypothetical protein NPIL_384471 [Nephila pilipes]